jgi:hypothetical protein
MDIGLPDSNKLTFYSSHVNSRQLYTDATPTTGAAVFIGPPKMAIIFTPDRLGGSVGSSRRSYMVL